MEESDADARGRGIDALDCSPDLEDSADVVFVSADSKVLSKRQRSDSMASEYNKRRSVNRPNEDLLLTPAQTQQAAEVSTTNVDDLPLATEVPSFDVHVKLLDPDTQDMDRPVFCAMDPKLGTNGKEHLKEWFEMLCSRDTKEFRPWWSSGKQRDMKGLGCIT